MIYKKYPSNLKKIALTIFFLFLSSPVSLAKPQNKTIIPVKVGVILGDLEHSVTEEIWLSCIKLAISDFYASHVHYKTRLVLNIRESKNNIVAAAAKALDLIKNEKVKAIIGPVTSMETSFVISLGEEARVPIISFSATSPSLTSLSSPYFFQFAQNDSSQVKAISAIVKHFGWRHVVPIYVDTSSGEAVIPYLIDALEEVNARVPYRSVISPTATDDQIEKELYKLKTMQTRVFVLHMTPELCSRLVHKANEIGMMTEGYVWITTNGLTNSLKTIDFEFLDLIDGVLGVETYIPKQLQQFMSRLHRQIQKYTTVRLNLDVFGLWAYDATFALAMAIEQVYGNTTSVVPQDLNVASNKLTDLESVAVSRDGPQLRQALLTTRFQGIAGDFSLIDGQLQSSTFQIVNINGGASRKIGFWTPQHGLVNKTFLSSNIGPIIWPGDSLSVPKGWEIPTNGIKLKIGVPVKDGFIELVKVTTDPSTNTTDVTGFSIDVFKAAVEMLPYALPYDFVPFTNPDGTNTGLTYNDLCDQNFDAVVGMPYTEAGVVMVAPVKDIKRQSAWTFLKPWRWDLWLTIACFFLFIGFVVWVLEHRINKHFRGPPAYQVGTSIWYSFSTMVFAQPARVYSNLARFVMTVWIFVVLVLTINYTASLTSLYTVEKFQPTVTTLNDLLRNGDNVGYVRNYVRGILNQVGFDNSKLKAFDTMEEIDEALSKGSANGGIAAVVDESPNMKIFIAKYCKKYTMLGPFFKTDGFAFVFPKHSPLVRDVSQALLNVTEGELIMNIENKWFKKESHCQDLNTNVSSKSLGTDSFWVLFVFVGLVSTLALIIFVASFIYRHRHVLVHSDTDSKPSTSEKVRAMFKIFNEKDLNYHTFKTKQPQETAEASSNNNSCPRSPVLHHNPNHRDSYSVFDIEQPQYESPEEALATTDDVVTVQEMHRTTP
ncbi:glutamate receptor 2.8 [Rosa chinensis]|uniref:glutamate receptor 2.8 n=1 Tax=Rosa chinensis TaxID=74649 RepID=UPI001AD8D260|nr:glutamate receptor 2.8 [Rosa chinensis]